MNNLKFSSKTRIFTTAFITTTYKSLLQMLKDIRATAANQVFQLRQSYMDAEIAIMMCVLVV